MDMDTGRDGRGIRWWTTVTVGVLVVLVGVTGGATAVPVDPGAGSVDGATTTTATTVAGADDRANATTISLDQRIEIQNPGERPNWYKVYVGERGTVLELDPGGGGGLYYDDELQLGHEINGSFNKSVVYQLPERLQYVMTDSGYLYVNTEGVSTEDSDSPDTLILTAHAPAPGIYNVANTSTIPSTAQPGQELTVTTDVTYNRTYVLNPERAVLRLSIDGEREAVSYHDIGRGRTKTVQFTHATNYTDDTGSHNVTVEALPAWAVQSDLDGTTEATTYTLEASDIDGDGLYDFREDQGETDKTDPDTDGDGLADGRELELGTEPTVADSDGDGLDDGREAELGTDPTVQDTDGEGLDDAREQEVGTNATLADSDDDGLDDAQELELGTDPTESDTDGDGTPDGAEIENGTDPLSGGSSDDATSDGNAGSTGDGDGGTDGGGSDDDGAAGTVGGDGAEQNAVTAGGGGGLSIPWTPVVGALVLLGLLAGGGAVYARRDGSTGSTPSSDPSFGGSGAAGGESGSTDARGTAGSSSSGSSGAGAGAGSVGGTAASTEGLSSGGEWEYDDLDVGERIGTGGNADVFRATAPNGTVLAVKQPRLQGTVDRETMERFVGEAEQWAALDDSEHIVDVLGWGARPIPWLGMEYMGGGSLAEHDLGALDFGDAVGVALATVGGVKHAHEYGVVHHDLKPENVLLSDDASPDVKVADWGLSKLLLEHSGSVEGLSPQYAAPEQFDPDRFGTPDKRTDIYQLGAVCYELFTGRPPFEGDQSTVMYSTLEKEVAPPTRVDPQLPPAIDDVLLTALAKDPADRYESVLYLRDELARLER